MEGLWLASYLALWLLVFMQTFLIFALMRQVGLLHMSIHSILGEEGLAIGERAPVEELRGRVGELGFSFDPPKREAIVIFTQSGCRPCDTLVEELSTVNFDSAEVVLVNRGSLEDLIKGRAMPQGVVAVEDEDSRLWNAFKIGGTPWAYILDEQGIVRGKGVVNTGEHVLNLLAHASSRDRKGGEERVGETLSMPAEKGGRNE